MFRSKASPLLIKNPERLVFKKKWKSEFKKIMSVPYD